MLRNSTLREYDRVFVAVNEYISQHFAREDITIDDFCNDRNYSRRSTQRALTYLGTSWKSLLRKQRMDVAKRLLIRTDMSVKDISNSVGFIRPSYFAHVFAQQYGLSPRSYRQSLNGRGT